MCRVSSHPTTFNQQLIVHISFPAVPAMFYNVDATTILQKKLKGFYILPRSSFSFGISYRGYFLYILHEGES